MRLFPAAALLAVLPAWAQESARGRPYPAHGFFACGGGPHREAAIGGTFVCQAGAEVFVYRRLSVGADVGAERYAAAGGYPKIPAGTRLDILLAWHFISNEKNRKWAPFLAVGGGTSNRNAEAVYGGGVGFFAAGTHYWMRPRLGLRMEFRGYVALGTLAHGEVTAGLVFR